MMKNKGMINIMKVYLVYAKIDIDLWEDKMKLYINQTDSMFDKFRFDSSTNSYVGLYAWTHNKKIIEMFKDSRIMAFNRGMYKIHNIKVNRDTFMDFIKDNKDKEIVLRHLVTKKSEEGAFKNNGEYCIYTILTRNEFDVCTDDSFARTEMFEAMCDKLRVDYYGFNNKFKTLLERVGYATEFDVNCIDDDYNDYYECRADLANYNASYGLSSHNTPIACDLYGDRYALFKNIYFEMLAGYKSGDIIHSI